MITAPTQLAVAEITEVPVAMRMRNDSIALVWRLPPGHWCWSFTPPFGIRGRVTTSPRVTAIHQWRLDGRSDNLAENPYDLMLEKV